MRLIFRRQDKVSCHKGAVNVLLIDSAGIWSAGNASLLKKLEICGLPAPNDGWWDSENEMVKSSQEKPIPIVISAGADGYIRLWSGH